MVTNDLTVLRLITQEYRGTCVPVNRTDLAALFDEIEELRRQVDGRVTMAEEAQRRHDAVEALAAEVKQLRAAIVELGYADHPLLPPRPTCPACFAHERCPSSVCEFPSADQ